MTDNVIIISKIDGEYLVTSPDRPYIRKDIDSAMALVRQLVDMPIEAMLWPCAEPQITPDEIEKLSKEG